MSRKLSFSEEEFTRLYKENKNDREIAKLLNCNSSVIQNYRKRKNLSKNFEYKSSLEDYFDKIIELKNQDKGYKTIAKELGLIPANVRYILKKYNIPNTEKKFKNIVLSDFQKEMLIGTMLGDGHLSKRGLNSSLNFGHCIKQKQYLEHKIDVLKEFNFWTKQYKITNSRYKKENEQIKAVSKVHPILTTYRNLFYKDNVKVITTEILENFTEVSLAYLFMDDGSKNRTISLCNFKLEDIELLKQFLKSKWNIDSTITKNKILYIKANSSKLFYHLINPYIVETMKYKMC